MHWWNTFIKRVNEFSKAPQVKGKWILVHDPLPQMFAKSTILLWQKLDMLHRILKPTEGILNEFTHYVLKVSPTLTINTPPGDRPMAMVLDAEGFAMLNRAADHNVSVTYELPDTDPEKFSLATPNAVQKSYIDTPMGALTNISRNYCHGGSSSKSMARHCRREGWCCKKREAKRTQTLPSIFYRVPSSCPSTLGSYVASLANGRHCWQTNPQLCDTNSLNNYKIECIHTISTYLNHKVDFSPKNHYQHLQLKFCPVNPFMWCIRT